MSQSKQRQGFSLIELVVVIMIIAIIGAVAAPRMMGTRQGALDAQAIKALANIRNAISMFASENAGVLPGANGTEATFKSDIATFLRGPFPKIGIGPTAGNAAINAKVRMDSTAGPLVAGTLNTEAWAYNYSTGEFIIDYKGATVTDPNLNYDQL